LSSCLSSSSYTWFCISLSSYPDFPCCFFNCSSGSVTRSYRRPILHSGLFISPQKTFHLPSYVEAAAHAYAHSLSPSYDSDRFSGDSRVLEFLDISADELEEHFLDVSDVSSSATHSTSATSCSSSPSATSILISRS
jgi:hypothetical protein